MNRCSDLRYTHAVSGESIAKAIRDIMRLSSGLKYLLYVLVQIKLCGTSQNIYKYSTTNCQNQALQVSSPDIPDVHELYMLYINTP